MPRKSSGTKTVAVKEPPSKKAAGAPPAAAVVEKDPDAEPYAVGSTLLVRWNPDQSERLATVIERSERKSGWHYYVHYHDFNRRMDEWVSGDRILKPPSQVSQVEEEKKNGSSPSKKREREDEAEEEEENDGELLVVAGYDRSGASGALNIRKVTAVGDMEHDEHEGLDEASLKEHEEVTKVKNIGAVELGKWIIETWYFSPYPKEVYPDGYAEMLYVCEFSFSFFRHKEELTRWTTTRIKRRSPPGNEIYRHEGLAMFEVDGAEDTMFCQNLCYFAKLFLDHKTLYFDVDPFLFYVLCEYDEFGYHPVGYFSKEKLSEVGYNLACILTFPPQQRKGYGRFLIAFSYALSKKEGKVGAPEKPLSDLGHVSYRSYWSATLVDELCNRSSSVDALSVMELSKTTSIMADDVIATLQYLGLIRSVGASSYVLWADQAQLDKLKIRYPVKEPLVDPDKLHWTPFVHLDNKRDKFSIKAKKSTDAPAAGHVKLNYGAAATPSPSSQAPSTAGTTPSAAAADANGRGAAAAAAAAKGNTQQQQQQASVAQPASVTHHQQQQAVAAK